MSEDDNGFYTKKNIRIVVGISITQIDRLESKKLFPMRVLLSGTSKTSRVGWVKSEVHAWCLMKAAQRRF